MSRLVVPLVIPLVGLFAAIGCETEGVPPLAPQRDEWRTVADTEFPYLDGEGNPTITSLQVGGRLFDKNFAPRGDVTVIFDPEFDAAPGQPGRIRVEMRRFGFASREEDARELFDRIQPWISASSPSRPAFPGAGGDPLDCTEGWRDGCGIRIWYDGDFQPTGVGADLRVTLPGNYAHALRVETEDDDARESYLNRGDVCVQGARGSTDISLESGRVHVILADDAVATPTCTTAQIGACETYVGPDGEAAPWDPGCGCSSFASVAVSTFSNVAAANVAVDVPGDLWARIQADNLADPFEAENCEADLSGLGAGFEAESTGFSYRARGEFNRPPGAPTGSGFGVAISSNGCAPVAYVQEPTDYMGPDAMARAVEQRGNLSVCDGCLREQTCADLLP